jgi:hypothetical protein
MTFIVTELEDNEFEVSGTDAKGIDNTIVLESEAWATYLYLERHKQATEEFNAVAKAELDTIFARIFEAAEQVKTTLGTNDELDSVTVTEGIEGVPAKKIPLDKSGRVLKLLATSNQYRVRWAGDRLVIVK